MDKQSNENFDHLSDNYARVNYNSRIEDGVETVIPHVKNMCKNKKYNMGENIIKQDIHEGFISSNMNNNITNRPNMTVNSVELSDINHNNTPGLEITYVDNNPIEGRTQRGMMQNVNKVTKVIADVNDDCDVRERYLARNLKLNQTIPKPNIINNIENIVDSVNNNKNRNDNQLYDDIDVKSLNSMMSADDNNSLNDIYSDLLTLN